jgi:CubicO group peptidase (beta-lactamase class C family)
MSALPRDVARFGLLLAERRTDIVSARLLDDILRGGHREQWARGDFSSMWAEGAYRACWYAPNIDPDVVVGIGIHGQMLYVDVPRQVVVVVVSSWSEPDDDDWHLDNHAVCRTLARALA